MGLSSPASKGTGSDRLGYLLRELTDRVRRLENRSTLSVGKWRLRQDPVTGNLLATNTESGTTTTIAIK